MNRYISKFIAYLEVEKNYSPHTILNYKSDLEEFALFLEKISIEKVEYSHLRRFLAQLRAKEHKPRTVARKLSSLRSFFKFLTREGFVKTNPASLLMSPKLDKPLSSYRRNRDINQKNKNKNNINQYMHNIPY